MSSPHVNVAGISSLAITWCTISNKWWEVIECAYCSCMELTIYFTITGVCIKQEYKQINAKLILNTETEMSFRLMKFSSQTALKVIIFDNFSYSQWAKLPQKNISVSVKLSKIFQWDSEYFMCGNFCVIQDKNLSDICTDAHPFPWSIFSNNRCGQLLGSFFVSNPWHGCILVSTQDLSY